MVQILFYRNKCIGCNACVEIAPERWRVSRKDGKCNLIGGMEKKGIFQIRVGMEEYEDNVRAAANCPAKVIQVRKW